MKLTRRGVLAGLGGSCAWAAGAPVWAASELTVGGMALTTLSDGNLTLPVEFIFAPTPEEIAASVREEYGLTGDTLTPPCNVTLLRRGEDVILFDCGSGPAFQPSVGSLPASLDAVGVAPDEVTHIVFTHAHPDHIWGLLDDFDDPLFPNARLLMGAAELDYWRDPETATSIGEARAAFAAGALRRIEAMGDAWETFGDGDEVLPGVTAVLSAGHTPGHMAFVVSDGGDAAMIVGDAIGNHHIAFAAPGARTGNDQDMETAAATRLSLLDRIVSDGMALVGFHLPDGGVGRVERVGDAYRFSPL